MIDESGGEKVPYDGRSATDAHVLAIGCLTRGLERFGGGCVEEVERGATLHLDRWPRPVGEHEGRRVERRVRTPPARPVRIVLPAGRAELVGAHYLGADAELVALGEGIVGTHGPARLCPEPGGEHPFVEPLAGVAEGCFGGLGLPGSEAVERNGQVVDTRARHRCSLRTSCPSCISMDYHLCDRAGGASRSTGRRRCTACERRRSASTEGLSRRRLERLHGLLLVHGLTGRTGARRAGPGRAHPAAPAVGVRRGLLDVVAGEEHAGAEAE